MTRYVFAAGMLTLLLTIAAGAKAEGSYGSDVYTKDTWPSELVKRPLTLSRGLAQVDLPLVFNLSTDAVGSPVFIPAQLSYGVTDAATVAITHGLGLCLSGTSNGCAKVYNDIGFAGTFAIAPRGAFQTAFVAGLDFLSISDPFAAAAVIGLDTRFDNLPVALRVDPRLVIGLNQRDAGNRELLVLPVSLEFQATPNVALTVGSGLTGQLDPVRGSFTDTIAVPLSFTALYGTQRFDLGASFGFLNLRGFGSVGATDARVGQVFVSFRV